MRPVWYITLCCPQNIVELLTPRSVHLIGFQRLSFSSSFDPKPFLEMLFGPKNNPNNTSRDEIVLIPISPKPAFSHNESSVSEIQPPDGEELGRLPTHASNVHAEGVRNVLWLPRASISSDETGARVRRGLAAEKDMTLFECCRKYPKAISWSLLLFLTVVMEAYDKSLISGFIAFPSFRRRYGEPRLPLADSPENQAYEISPLWQMGLQNAAVACEIIGLLAHGYITYIIGYRKVMIASLIWMCLAVFPAFFSHNIAMLLASQALCGEFTA